jgi:ABC-2 type transport system ATP-binding protein
VSGIYDRAMSGAAAVETAGLSKTYRDANGGVAALVDLDLRVERGEIFGYLGPNGAGKSTTIRLLVGSIRPTRGSASVLGFDTQRDRSRACASVGYLPGDPRLSDRLTGRQELESLARLRGRVDARLRDELCERLGAVLDRPIRQLSRGNRQKLGIVQAFMHRPELVVLDEPSSGLDPLLQNEFRALLAETAARGATVFLSSHSLDEVQHVAHRVGIIRAGRLVDVDAVDALRERALRHVTITFAQPQTADRFASIDGVRGLTVDDTVLRLAAPERAMDAVVKAAAQHDVVDFVSQPADLEEIFLDLYRGGDDGT